MPTVFDRAASVLAADPNIGAEALYTPQGEAPLALRLVLSREEAPQIGGAGMIVTGYAAMIPVGAIPDRPQRGELLSAAGQDFIVETAERDETGASWRVLLRKG